MNLPPPISLEEAQSRLLESISPLDSDNTRAEMADGRYLAEALVARRTQPAADLSAMDGYAVGENDQTGPWTIIGESAAGHPFAGRLQAGEAVRISTGALMPQGGGAVLLQENATRSGSDLALSGEDTATPRHIRRAGFDFHEGETLQQAGALLTPARIALALSGGNSELCVGKRPTLTIIDSGDELASEPGNVGQHQIPASNGLMLAAMAAPLVSAINRIGPVPDRMDDMLAALDKASQSDVIVTSGGASVGDHDLVRPALELWGAKIDFWRIAMKPGKPLMVARKGAQIILGLPGNPVSSYVTAYLFLLPLLRKLSGASNPRPRTIELPLGGALPATGRRAEFVRASLTGASITPLSQQDSSALAGLSRANALIYRQREQAPAPVGEVVPVYLLQNGGIA